MADFWCSSEKGFTGALLKAKLIKVSTLSNIPRQLSCLRNRKRDRFLALCTSSQVQVWLNSVQKLSHCRNFSKGQQYLWAGLTTKTGTGLGRGWSHLLQWETGSWCPTADADSPPFPDKALQAVLKSHPIPFKPVSMAGVIGRPADESCFQRHWDEWARGSG